MQMSPPSCGPSTTPDAPSPRTRMPTLLPSLVVARTNSPPDSAAQAGRSGSGKPLASVARGVGLAAAEVVVVVGEAVPDAVPGPPAASSPPAPPQAASPAAIVAVTSASTPAAIRMRGTVRPLADGQRPEHTLFLTPGRP